MKLFEPLNVGGMEIANRVMVPAMVTRLSGEDGLVNQDIVDRHIRYAQGGAGLIVIEAMAVHHAKSGPLLRISDDRFVPGLTDLVRRIHNTSDSKVVPQIIHFMKVAKSGWRQTVDLLSLAEIDQIVEEFGDAVARARVEALQVDGRRIEREPGDILRVRDLTLRLPGGSAVIEALTLQLRPGERVRVIPPSPQVTTFVG